MNYKCYIISYDLRSPYQNYEALYKAIKSFSYWGKITESTWAILAENTHNATSIRNYLQNYIDKDDRIFVIRSGKEAAWNNTFAEDEWMQKCLII